MIKIYNDALSADICDFLIDEFEYYHKKSKTHKGNTSRGHNSKIKDSWDFDIFNYWKNFQTEKDYTLMFEKIFKSIYIHLMKYDEEYEFFGEFLNYKENNYWRHENVPKVRNLQYTAKCFNIQPHILLKKYEKNKQGYHMYHSDFDLKSNKLIKKSHVVMFYLNDVSDGGETEWYHQKLKVKPKKGTCVIWPVYFTHKHKGHVPLSNDKYILNTWVEPNLTGEITTNWRILND